MATSAHDHSDAVPGLTPEPDDVLAMIKDREYLISERNALRDKLKTITEKIHQADSEIKDVITDQWAKQVQNSIITDDYGKALLLGFGIKGVDNGHSSNIVGKAKTSFPFIRVEIGGSLHHILHFRNNESKKKKLPPDAKHINIYQQIGGTEPTDISQMIFLGSTTTAKYVNHFKSEDRGKTVFYIAVYIDRKTLKPLNQSFVTSALVN